MVEIEKAVWRRTEVGQPSGNSPGAFGRLMRVCKVKIYPFEHPRRAHGGFKTANANVIDGERKKDIGIADYIVIKEVSRSGAEVGDVSGPGSDRNC